MYFFFSSLSNPGEFTKRAYINGKIDLLQSEAVGDLIHSQTKSSHLVSLQNFQGKLSDKLQELKNELRIQCGLVELELDFSDDVEFSQRDEISSNITYNTTINFTYYSIILGRGCCMNLFNFRIGPLIGTNFKKLFYGTTFDVQLPTIFGSNVIPQYINFGTTITTLDNVEFHVGISYKLGFKSYQME